MTAKIYAQKAMALCRLWTTDLINAKFNSNTIHINMGQHVLEILHLVQVACIGGRNHTVSHPTHLTCQTSPGNIYVKSGK